MSLKKESQGEEIRVQFLIPKANVKKFSNRIQSLARKAVKLGCEPIELKEGAVVFKKIAENDFIECIEFFVTGKAPKINGYEFIARLDHTEAGNIVNTAPGKECPAEYRHTGSYCDHCKNRRYRTKLYVLQDEKGGYIQVGRSCLKHYNGHNDPLKVAAFFELLVDLEENLRGYTEGGRQVQMTEVETILAIAVMSINHYGFRKSNSEGGATKDDVAYYINPPIGRDRDKALIEKLKPTDEAKVKAKKIVAWVKTMGDDTNYSHNLQVLVAQGYAEFRDFGLLASAPWAYAKAVEDAKVKAVKSNKYIGEKGERLDLVLTLTRSTYLGTSSFGNTETERFVHSFEDAKGNAFCWFSHDIDSEKGDQITLRGTVKDHNDYQGRKQTVLTRCKIKGFKNG